MLLNSMGALQPGLSIQGRLLTNSQGNIDTNSAGYQYMIDTLTEIASDVKEQKHFQVAPGDYMPVDVGKGAFAEETVQNITFNTGGSPFDGDQSVQTDTFRVHNADIGISTLRMPNVHWAIGTRWTIGEIGQAVLSSNWDLVYSKLKRIKLDWDLLIQEVAFLGHPTKTE